MCLCVRLTNILLLFFVILKYCFFLGCCSCCELLASINWLRLYINANICWGLSALATPCQHEQQQHHHHQQQLYQQQHHQQQHQLFIASIAIALPDCLPASSPSLLAIYTYGLYRYNIFLVPSVSFHSWTLVTNELQTPVITMANGGA